MRAIGASNFTAERLESALAISDANGLPRYQTLQPLYNLYSREAYEAELEPACARAGIAVIPYFSLASGFLTGKYRSEADFGKSPRGARMGSQYLNDRGLRILAALDEAAKATGRHAGADLAGLADEQADHRRADRQRHLAPAAGGVDGRGAPDAETGGLSRLDAASA